MIRVIRTRTLRALREDAAEAARSEEGAQTYSDEATKWHRRYEEEVVRADEAEAAAEALREELATAREQQLLDAEDRVALRMLLRTARKQAVGRDWAFLLWRWGQLHSAHASAESAEAAAEAEGAAPDGWTPQMSGVPDTEVQWRMQPVRLASR